MRNLGRFFGVAAVVGLAIVTVGADRASASARPRSETMAGWQAAVTRLGTPGAGCFSAAFPDLQWHRHACSVAPRVSLVPRAAVRLGYVGDGKDYSAKVSGLISSATGTFTNVSPNIVEKDGTADSFSLQLNSQTSKSPACATSTFAKCRGWQQFVYDTHGDSIFMQYWLLNYGSEVCPSTWMTDDAGDCFKNSPAIKIHATAKQVLADLADVSLSGQASAQGNDTVSFSLNGTATAVSAPDDTVGLASYWNTAEWGVFGEGGGSEARFGPNTTLTAVTSITSSNPGSLECVKEGFTGETNNLSLAATPSLDPGLSEIASHQTKTDPGQATCASSS